ncbi:hypothetical protein BSKO_10792 [Bryopsis sp. KO-2023]|nr:hypothetical protein BSKO_10792 [Bryopsis sp. KO-2023]
MNLCKVLVLVLGAWAVWLPSTALLEDIGTEDDGLCPVGTNGDYLLLEEGKDDEARWSIFDQLSTTEIWDVINVLVDDMGFFHERNETYQIKDMPTPAGPDHIYRVELFEPSKKEALAYLDGDGPRPQRFAKAIVIRASAEPKDVMEYKVGPLPIPEDKRSRKEIKKKGKGPRPGVTVEELLEDGEMPFVKRPTHKYTSVWSETVVARVAYQLREAFKDSTGYCYGSDDTTEELKEETSAECGTSLLYWLEFPVLHSNDSKRISHIHWFFKPRNAGGEEFELHPVPISFKLDESGDEVDEWDVVDVEYCHQGPFPSVKAFLKAYRSDQLVKCVAPEWREGDYDESWSKTSGRTRFRGGSREASPRTFEPEGRRFSISGKTPGGGHHFHYLGWEGHIGMRPDTGLTLHDLRFRGNRVAYEVSLQEQYVAYSGYGGAGQVVYFDSYFGIGLSSFPLKKGLDCPESAEYLSVAKLGLTGIVENAPDIICIFEEDSQTTEWRHTHTNGTSHRPHLDAVRRSALIVRSIATIGNYDYIYDVRFKPDASIQVDVIMAGYMESSFFGPNGETQKDLPFGTRVHKYTFANLHDHLCNWKIDLDVLGTENSVHRHEVKLGTWEEALKSVDPEAKPPGWHTSPYVKYIDSSQPKEEFGMNKKSDDGLYVFTNDLKTNQWGQPRGYAIVHGLTHGQILPDSHPFTKAMAWSKYHLAVTQHKDSEPKSHAGIYDMNIPQKPHVSLDSFLDGESIVKEDLVGWLTMGLHHIPRSEDVPLISNFGTSFFIKPWNYYEELVSMDMGDNDKFQTCNPRAGSAFEYSWAWA